jgi:hypothetical protein
VVPGDAPTGLHDLADELVAEHVAFAHERDVSAEQVQVGPAGLPQRAADRTNIGT